MKNIIIAVPTEREAAFFADAGLSAEICGVGQAECAAATARLLADAEARGRRPELMVLAGIAGAYGDEPAVGDTVLVTAEIVADLGRAEADGSFKPLFQKTYFASFIPEGYITAPGKTVNTAGGLAMHSGGYAVPAAIENMEGAAFFAVCERFGIPAMEVRTISNRVGDPVTSDNLDLAARRLAAELKKIITTIRFTV